MESHMITKKDVEAIEKIKTALDPDLENLEDIVREDEDHKATKPYQNLSIFANTLYKKLPDFDTAMLGAIGFIGADLDTFTTFKEHGTTAGPFIENVSRISILKISFPSTISELTALTTEFKKYLTDKEGKEVCDRIIKNLAELDKEVKILQKKYLVNNEEKTHTPPAPK